MKPVPILKDQLERLVLDQVLAVLHSRIDQHATWLIKVDALQKQLLETSTCQKRRGQAIEAFIAYKQSLSNLVQIHFEKLQDQNSTNFVEQYDALLKEFTDTLESKITITQSKDRFYPIAKDGISIKLGKFFKNSFFKVSTAPKRTANLLRKVFRKPVKPISYWSQKIAFQPITETYFSSIFIEKVIPVFEVMHRTITETTLQYWKVDTVIDKKMTAFLQNEQPFEFSEEEQYHPQTAVILEQRKKDLKTMLSDIFHVIYEEYEHTLAISGTFERNNKKYTTTALVQRKIISDKKIKKNNEQWNTTYEALKDDWDVDLEIYVLVFKTHKEHLHLKETTNERAKKIISQFDIVHQYQKNLYERIKNATTSENLKKIIISEVKALEHHFNTEEVTKIHQEVTALELTSVLNAFENSQQQMISEVSKKRAIADEIDFLKPTATSAINYISPFELITYESWPSFKGTINSTKVAMADRLNEMLEIIHEVGQIATFNLESSLDLFDKESPENNPRTVALDGLQRNLEKLENLKASALSLGNNIEDLLRESLGAFTKTLFDFTKNENILKIRLTIAKAKSLETSKAFKEKVVNGVVYSVPIALAFGKKTFLRYSEYVRSKMFRFGLLDKSGDISEELSNFLLEAERSVDQLPFVYKRLFRSDTLHNEAFFAGNVQQIEHLYVEYTNWKKNRFAAVLIAGERGAGKSSLIHYFQQKKDIPSDITITLPLKNTIATAQLFFDFLNTSFSQNLNSIDQWVAYFNQTKNQLIVLEDIQYLYLRKINGFEALHTLTELISKTHNTKLWICTCSQYAFQFLNKSIRLSDQFSKCLNIDDTGSDVMTDAIIKRHKVSGYDLYFEAPPKRYLNKKYEKATEEGRQQMLLSEFYKDLNKIAKSNFKIAFMYWLRSANKVVGSTIYMRSLKAIDLSFVEKLATYRLVVLHTILLHEKLTLIQIHELSGQELSQTRRTIGSLFENGFLVLAGDYYMINTLLYRQIVLLLKSKNFIH